CAPRSVLSPCTFSPASPPFTVLGYTASSLPPIYFVLAFFFFNDTATTEIYTLSLHDALPIYHFYRSAHKFEQICRHRLRRQNVGYSNFSQPQSHLSFCVLLQYLVERRRVVTQLGKLD